MTMLHAKVKHFETNIQAYLQTDVLIFQTSDEHQPEAHFEGVNHPASTSLPFSILYLFFPFLLKFSFFLFFLFPFLSFHFASLPFFSLCLPLPPLPFFPFFPFFRSLFFNLSTFVAGIQSKMKIDEASYCQCTVLKLALQQIECQNVT